MTGQGDGYRVALVGAASLLGKELLAQFEERGFPLARLVTVEDELEEPELPIVDWQTGVRRMMAPESVNPSEFNFAFLAAESGGSEFLQRGSAPSPSNCTIIDLSGRVAPSAEIPVCIPSLERKSKRPEAPAGTTVISPHAATIILALLLERLAKRYALERASANVFSPASEIGARAIEELQAQTIQLLSFQNIPQKIYGAQIAFNLLARRVATRRESGAPWEERIRRELHACLGSGTPRPALRMAQAPVFYSLSVSLYVETRQEVSPAAVAEVLEGAPLKISKATDTPPSAVQASGSDALWVDWPVVEPGRPTGLWLWAVADSARFAALNAIETALSLAGAGRSLT